MSTWPDDYLIPGIEPYHVEDAGIIYCGKAEDILWKLPPGSIDVTITSPPYDELRSYKGFDWNFEEIALNLQKILVDGGLIVWIVGDACINGSESLSSFKQAIFFNEIAKLNLHDTMIYQKNCYPFPPCNRYFGVFEYMFIFSKGSPKTTNLIKVKCVGQKHKSSTSRQQDGSIEPMKYAMGRDTRVRDNIWKYDVGYGKSTNDNIAFGHPATFPEQLAADHILSWSNPGDIVLDCHLGSGTTAKKAKELGRKFIGIEISEEYCAIAVKRLRQGVLNFG